MVQIIDKSALYNLDHQLGVCAMFFALSLLQQ